MYKRFEAKTKSSGFIFFGIHGNFPVGILELPSIFLSLFFFIVLYLSLGSFWSDVCVIERELSSVEVGTWRGVRWGPPTLSVSFACERAKVVGGASWVMWSRSLPASTNGNPPRLHVVCIAATGVSRWVGTHTRGFNSHFTMLLLQNLWKLW